MRALLLGTLLSAAVFAGQFMPNSACKECHPLIYEEFQSSMHANSTIFKDPIHKAVWNIHPLKKKGSYDCAACHTPAADNLQKLIAPGDVVPDENDESQNQGVSCAYCHRIKDIKIGLKQNINILNEKPKLYYGTKQDHIKSPFHEIDTSNANFLKGNVCMGCHSHKKNRFGLNLCSTNENMEIEKSECVSCHMPKVAGSVSTLKETQKHSFHGFAGAHRYNEMLSKYVDIEFLPRLEDFEIAVNSKAPHDLLLHPLRVSFLKVTVIRNGKQVFNKKEIFVRIIGSDGKPTPPWKAKEVVKDTMIKANEKRSVKFGFKLQKGDKIKAVLGYRLVKPPMLKKLNLQNDETAKKVYVLKKAEFTL